jgi:DNA polymerase III epsilon subunit-like protein
MVHFTCDLCGKDLSNPGDGRYVVRIEAFPGFDPTEIREDDLDDDPMEAVAQILQRDEALLSEDLAAPLNKGFRFDLCPSCHRKFVKDPLGKDVIRSFNFSKN